MKVHLISYDLNRPGQDYTRLIARLQQHGAFRVLYSEWAVQTTWTAAQLRDDLRAYTDGNDRILVIQVAGEWAGVNLLASDSFKQIAA